MSAADNSALGSKPVLSFDERLHNPAPGVHMLQLWANVSLIETDEGVVLYDIGFPFYGPRIVKFLRSITDQPVRYIVYGHGHADHAFGAQHVLDDAKERGFPKPIIIAQKNLPARFDRYREMLGYHGHINRIQFDIPENLPAFVDTYIYPDLTFDTAMQFQLGGISFQLFSAMGETDDTTWLWVPEKKLAAVSDLWVWSCPNVGNPFKVQRYEVEWAKALESIAAREPEILFPGHGVPIIGQAEIQKACTVVARALRFLHEQVVDLLNQGKWQEEILQSFTWPKEFADSPYLKPIYGHPYFVVQAILRRYHGWFDGNASHLFPSASSEIAKEISSIVNDDEKILSRARELKAQGREQLSLHLADIVIDAGSPIKKAEALDLKRDLLQALADREPSLIARNIFLAGMRRAQKEMEKLK